VPDPSRTELVFQSGDCGKNASGLALCVKDEGSIGGAWATGMPAITDDESIAAQLARAVRHEPDRCAASKSQTRCSRLWYL
jgi:hypothetical protein